MKKSVKALFSVLMACIVFICFTAFTSNNTESTVTKSLFTKATATDFAIPTVSIVDITAKPAVEIVSFDTIHLAPINVYTRIDKKPLDKLLRSIKKDPKFYTKLPNTINFTPIMETMPELALLKPIEGYVTLMIPLPPLLVIRV